MPARDPHQQLIGDVDDLFAAEVCGLDPSGDLPLKDDKQARPAADDRLVPMASKRSRVKATWMRDAERH